MTQKERPLFIGKPASNQNISLSFPQAMISQ